MKMFLLTSGFPNGFTSDFIHCIKDYYINNGSFVLIASDFSGHSKTDKHTEEFIDMFRNNGITFNAVHIIDDRITQETAAEYIKNAAILWIAGGDTLKQIAYLKEYNLISDLQKREGITIGMSAGSINMAKKVVRARGASNNTLEMFIYDGIGLVDINIEPHLDSASEERLKDIYEASKYTTIYGLYDNTFIKIENNAVDIYGHYLKFENGDTQHL